MYFKNINNTNIDDELNSYNILSKIKNIILKYKLFIIIGIFFIIFIMMILLFYNKKVENYLLLRGEETITIYEDSDYVEPGFDAYNSKNEKLINEVKINSNLNTKEKGTYEIIYTLGNIIRTRKINVIEKAKNYTYIYLNPINNDVNIYLPLGSEYIEPGFKVYSNSNADLTNKVEVAGTVDINKKGSYQLTYTVVDDEGITISKKRLVTIMDTEINLSLNNTDWTNNNLMINININDEMFDYMILPDNTKINKNTYNYEISENGEYTFKVYNKKGIEKSTSINVKNIDKSAPTGSCVVDQNEQGSYITVKATDLSGINKYRYDGKYYSNNIIDLTSYIEEATVVVYDNANNSQEITCTIAPKPIIKNIETDGVIITVNAKKIAKEIAGYYFSYTNKRPSKTTGGYVATSKETIDVVRLPGTTYIWVEDVTGKISEPKQVTLTNDVLLITNGNDYTILENTKLSKYLTDKGWSIEELDKLIARSARAAGLYSKEAAATTAVAFQTVLAQKYKIKLPYWNGGKYWDLGVDPEWGKYKTHTAANGTNYYYYGLDCSGFTAWVYVNAGYDVKNTDKYPNFWDWKRLSFNKDNGEIGDFLVNDGHVKLIIGKTSDRYITAEAKGKDYGMVINTHKYSAPNNYKIVKADEIISKYKKINIVDYPSGF